MTLIKKMWVRVLAASAANTAAREKTATEGAKVPEGQKEEPTDWAFWTSMAYHIVVVLMVLWGTTRASWSILTHWVGTDLAHTYYSPLGRALGLVLFWGMSIWFALQGRTKVGAQVAAWVYLLGGWSQAAVLWIILCSYLPLL